MTTAFAIVALIIGLGAGAYFTNRNNEKNLSKARQTANDIVEDANKEAESVKKEALLDRKSVV